MVIAVWLDIENNVALELHIAGSIRLATTESIDLTRVEYSLLWATRGVTRCKSQRITLQEEYGVADF